MSTDTTIPQRVAKGAALMDKEMPGWDRRIDLDVLDLQNSCDCILGQEFRPFDDPNIFGYDIGRDELFGDDDEATAAHGFTLLNPAESFDALTAEWKRVILARRGGENK